MGPLKNICSLIIICLLLSLYPAGCALHNPAPPRWTSIDISSLEGRLDLEKCIELARGNQIQAVQWKARLDAAHAQLRQSKIIPNPVVGIDWEDIGLADELGKSISTVTYGVSYPILFWWSYPEKIRAARLNQLSEENAVLSEKRQMEIEIASAYFNIVAEQRKAALAEDIAKAYSEGFRLAQRQNQQGDVSGFNMEQARLMMNKAESELKDAQNQLRADRMSFAFALGADRPFYPVFVDCGAMYLYPEGVAEDRDELTDAELDAVVQNDYDYIAKQIATDYTASRLRIEKLNAIPLADIAGSGGLKDSTEGDSKTYSIEVPVPLFDHNQAGIESANAELRAAQAEEEKARRDSIAKITAKWEEYRTLVWKWEQYSSSSISLADNNSRTAARLYEMGRISYSELLESQAENKSIQMEAIDTWRDLCIVSWTLTRMLGKDGAGIYPVE